MTLVATLVHRLHFRTVLPVLLLFGAVLVHLSWLIFFWGGEAQQLLLGNVLYLLPTLFSTVVVLITAFNRTGKDRRGWLLIGLGIATLTVGNGFWSYFELIAKTDPFPSSADVFYLLFGPLFAAGLLQLMPGPRDRLEGTKLGLDLAITLGAISLYFWRFLLAPPFTWGMDTWMTSVTLAYPLLDLLLLSLLLLMVFQGRSGSLTGRVVVLLGLGIVSQVVADTLFNAVAASGAYYNGHPLDAFFSVSALFYGLAAYAASPTPRAVPAPRATPLNAPLPATLPYLALALGFGLLIATERNPAAHDTLGGQGVRYGGMFVTLLVVLRQFLAISENWRLVKDLGALSTTLEHKVTERTRELEALGRRYRYDALHDALTGLPNRAYFWQQLQDALGRGQLLAVLYLDFDHFKSVNDSFGHPVGDALLIAIGRRIEVCTRPGDFVARLGGDEFALLLPISARADAVEVAERLVQVFQTPLKVERYRLYSTTSIGVTLAEGDYNAEGLLRDADIAMYRAKALGRSRYVVFEPAMRETMQAHLALEKDLRRAVERSELEVYYQPVLHAESGSISGFEALARWRHPERGFISPAEFIPVAEESDLVVAIDRWVLQTACAQFRAWLDTTPDLTLSVNLSSRQFAQTDLALFIARVLTTSELAPQRLKLELTERLLLDTSPLVQGTLKAVRQLGVRLHIDDFGTGYSSLAYLQRFDAEVLKIDHSFVAKMLGNEDTAELVRTIINMAHNLGMKVVAEGIESEAQFVWLRALGCEYVQGFLFSDPVPVEAADKLLRQNYLNQLRIAFGSS